MTHYFNLFEQYILTHPYLGLLFAFVIAFLESLPVVGTLVPGSVTMTVIGILVGRDAILLSSTLVVASLGALIGDILGFVIGKYNKERLIRMWPFRNNPKWLAHGETFFEKHGGKSIIFGRFIGPTRSALPFIAGLLNMDWRRFIIAVIPSAILWAALYLIPGVLIGALSLSLPKGEATFFSLIGFGVILVLWLLFWVITQSFSFLVTRINAGIQVLWNGLSHYPSTTRLKRLVINRQDPEDHRPLLFLLLALIAGGCFVLIAINVVFHFGAWRLNHPIHFFLETIRRPTFAQIMGVASGLGNKYILAIVTSMVIAMALVRRRWVLVYTLAVLFLVSVGVVWSLKHLFFFEPRPFNPMMMIASSSFPSGHTFLATTVIGFLSLLCAYCLSASWRWLSYTTASFLILCIAISRLYLGAHWFCDVLASIALGLSLLWVTVIVFRHVAGHRSVPRYRWELVTIVLSILIPWSVNATHHWREDFYRYALYTPQKTITAKGWWNSSGSDVPLYLPNRFGYAIQPFNIQWVGDLNVLSQSLLQHGWQRIHSRKE